MNREFVAVNPENIKEYQELITQAYPHSVREEAPYLSETEAEAVEATKFPNYLRTFLTVADSQGIINLSRAKAMLEEKLGSNFNENVFQNTIGFYEATSPETGWETLKRQAQALVSR